MYIVQSTLYACQVFKANWIFWQIFEKYSNIKIHENPSSGSDLFHAVGQKDRHNDANTRFSKFCERAWKLIFQIGKREGQQNHKDKDPS